MKKILFVTILNLFCALNVMARRPLDIKQSLTDKPGTYSESINSREVSITTDKDLAHSGKSFDAKKSIEVSANKLKISGSTYRSPMITLLAILGIELAKSNFDGVLSVEGNKLTIRDCIIKSLVITNYEKIIVELLGSTVIQEGVRFIGDPGVLKAESSVKINGGIVNGVKKAL